MKIINDWPLYIPTADPLVSIPEIPELNIDRLYYRLVSALYILYKDNALDENNYFDEDN